MSPVRLAPSTGRSRHGCDAANDQGLSTRAPLMASAQAAKPRSRGRPPALAADRHGDFPRSLHGSKLPMCALRSRASPAPFDSK